MTIEELKSKLRLPIIVSPMFIVSGTKLVIEACKNGVVGTFPSLNGRTSEDFEKMLIEITSELKKYEEESGIKPAPFGRSEEHTSELQSRPHLVCRLLLEKKKQKKI